jgi:hypothetical protein
MGEEIEKNTSSTRLVAVLARQRRPVLDPDD